MKIDLITVSGVGAPQPCEIGRHGAIGEIQKLIGCDCCDVVNLRDGRVMLVDDTGKIDGKPVNSRATEIYRSIYPLAAEHGASIHGDVAIAIDEDFA